MALNETPLVLHHIRVKLHPDYLPGCTGGYVARTRNEKTLSVENVCSTLKTRGGFTGNYDDLVAHVRQYLDEVAYQLCDGYAVNNGWYTIRPHIGGVFESAAEAHDHDKHPIGFRFGVRDKLRDLAKHIVVEVQGVANTGAYIDSFTDTETGSTNSSFVPGHLFTLHGKKIKVAGSDPSCGVYFVPEDGPDTAAKKARLGTNSHSALTAIAPDTGYARNRIAIRTQYSGVKGRLLKVPRTIISPFTVQME